MSTKIAEVDNMLFGCAVAAVILMFIVAGCQESEIEKLKKENENLREQLQK